MTETWFMLRRSLPKTFSKIMKSENTLKWVGEAGVKKNNSKVRCKKMYYDVVEDYDVSCVFSPFAT